ncbi:hypothetical protein ANO11243_097180 [Dothideomycetidae sp. 11243]|nr:hypothetical protein ANO11243_097180 [fungal sp. No.11243]
MTYISRLLLHLKVDVSSVVNRLAPSTPPSRLAMSANNLTDYGQAQHTQGESASALLATAQVGITMIALQILLAVLFRKLTDEDTSKLTPIFGRAWALLKGLLSPGSLPDAGYAGFDFVRFVLLLVRLNALATLLLVPVLIPTNVVQPNHSEGAATGLDSLSYLNILPSQVRRLWAHLLGALVYTSIFLYLTSEELRRHTERTAWSDGGGRTKSLLVCGIDDGKAWEDLNRFFDQLLGGVTTLRRVEASDTFLLHHEAVSSLIHRIEKAVAKSCRDGQPRIQKIQQAMDRLCTLASVGHDGDRRATQCAVLEVDQLVYNALRLLSFEPLQLRLIGDDLDSIMWCNALHATKLDRLRSKLLGVLTLAVVIVLALPVSFQALLSTLSDRIQAAHDSGGVDDAKQVTVSPLLRSYLNGALPQMIALAFSLVSPAIIRFLICKHRLLSIEERDSLLHRRLFLFLFLQLFVFLSLSVSLTSILGTIVKDPDQVPALLCVQLPKAGNYFISFVVMQGLHLAISGVLDWEKILDKLILCRFVTVTPRHALGLVQPDSLEWPVLFTSITILGVIVQMPVLWSFSLRMTDQEAMTHAAGYLVTSVFYLFSGLYVMQFCTLGVFLTAKDEQDRSACLPQAALMALITVGTVIYHRHLYQMTHARLLSVIHPRTGRQESPGPPAETWSRSDVLTYSPDVDFDPCHGALRTMWQRDGDRIKLCTRGVIYVPGAVDPKNLTALRDCLAAIQAGLGRSAVLREAVHMNDRATYMSMGTLQVVPRQDIPTSVMQ